MQFFYVLLCAVEILGFGYGLTGPNGSTKRISRLVRLLGTRNEPLGNSILRVGKSHHIYKEPDDVHESSAGSDILTDSYFE
jgi:hypothetical protein